MSHSKYLKKCLIQQNVSLKMSHSIVSKVYFYQFFFILGSKTCAIQANVGIGCAPKMRIEKMSDDKRVNNGCQDMALLPNGALEGPLTIQCDIPDNLGMLSKCCPLGQILDATLKYCIKEDKRGEFLPNRMVRDPLTGMSTGHYHLEITQPTCQEGQVPVFKTPSYVFTNGTVYFQDQNSLVSSTYECLERYQIGEKTSEVPAAMVCQTIIETKAEDGPKCEGKPEFCVPKCCPKDEIFVLDQGMNR